MLPLSNHLFSHWSIPYVSHVNSFFRSSEVVFYQILNGSGLKQDIYYSSPGTEEGVLGDKLLGPRSGKPSHALLVADHRQVHLKASVSN
jgi:hypothetical protein